MMSETDPEAATMNQRSRPTCLLSCLALLAAASAGGGEPPPKVHELLTNGSFEANGGAGTDVLDGWSVVRWPSSSGSWYAQTGTASPLATSVVEAPADGAFAAMTDQQFSSSQVLYQDLAVPAGGAELRCDVYIDNRAGAFVDAGDLDFTGAANQQARVDLMDPAAADFDVGAGVLLNLFLTLPGDAAVQSYQPIVADLTAFEGQTVRLRFAEVDNQNFLHMGVDNCSALATPSVVEIPALGSFGLAALALALAALGCAGLRRRTVRASR